MRDIDNMINNSLNSNKPSADVLDNARQAMLNKNKSKAKGNPLWFRMSTALAALLIVCVISLSGVAVWLDKADILPDMPDSFQQYVEYNNR